LHIAKSVKNAPGQHWGQQLLSKFRGSRCPAPENIFAARVKI
jgi:hypothetical protein